MSTSRQRLSWWFGVVALFRTSNESYELSNAKQPRITVIVHCSMRCGLAQLLPAAATKFRTGGSGFQRFLIPAETLFFSASKMLGNEIAFNLSGTSDVTLALVHSITVRYQIYLHAPFLCSVGTASTTRGRHEKIPYQNLKAPNVHKSIKYCTYLLRTIRPWQHSIRTTKATTKSDAVPSPHNGTKREI